MIGNRTTIPALTYYEVRDLAPCSRGFARIAKLMGGAKKWNGKKINAQQARKLGATLEDIIWAASAVARKNTDVERRLRLCMADCAAHVLHIYENQINDDRPRNAIVAIRKFERGQISAAGLRSDWDAARAAAMDAARDSARAAARAAAAAWAAAWASAWAPAGELLDVVQAADWAAAASAVPEQEWQFDRLILWLSGNEPTDYPLPNRKTK